MDPPRSKPRTCARTQTPFYQTYNLRHSQSFRSPSPTLPSPCMLVLSDKLTLFKLFIRSILTYAAPFWNNPSFHNHRHLQISQSKCLRVIGDYPRRTPIPYLHTSLNIPPILNFIHHLTDIFFSRCLLHPNPLIQSIGNYTLADLHLQYKKYVHKRPKHFLL